MEVALDNDRNEDRQNINNNRKECPSAPLPYFIYIHVMRFDGPFKIL